MGSSFAFCFLKDLTRSEWIDLIAIVVNGAIAIWIVHTIQVNASNKRVLKDHFIDEVKDLRDEYKRWLNVFYNGELTPKEVTPCFKLLSIKASNCLEHINSNFDIDKKIFKPYLVELPDIITNSEEFNSNFRDNTPFRSSEETQLSLLRFQQEHNIIFNQIIVDINGK